MEWNAEYITEQKLYDHTDEGPPLNYRRATDLEEAIFQLLIKVISKINYNVKLRQLCNVDALREILPKMSNVVYIIFWLWGLTLFTTMPNN